jgi:hypothetical protein
VAPDLQQKAGRHLVQEVDREMMGQIVYLQPLHQLVEEAAAPTMKVRQE